MIFYIEVRKKTSQNYLLDWQDIKPLVYEINKPEYAESYASQVLANAKNGEEPDERLEVRWNWRGSRQGYYIS